MPDDLPPLEQLPQTATPSPEFVGQLEHSADWARTFGGSDTNLAQRGRHNQDIAAYAQVLQDQRAQAQADLIQHSQAAQNLFFTKQKLDLQQQEADARMKHAAELQPGKMQIQQGQLAAAQATERRRVQEGIMKNTTDEHEANFFADRAAFLTDNPNATQEQIDANDISLNSRYPHAMKSPAAKEIVDVANRNSLARQTEARKAATIASQNQTATDNAAALGLVPHQVTASGALTFATPAEAKGLVDQNAKRQAHLESLRMKPNLDPDVKAYLDSEILKLKPVPAGSGNVPPVTPPTATAAPAGASGQPPKYADADAVKAAFRAGTITQDQAVAALRSQFGHQ